MLYRKTSYDFISWDIEITKELPEDNSKWDAHWPFGISCAQVGWRDVVDGSIAYKTWQSPEGYPAMTVEQCQDMVDWLVNSQRNGYKIATTNGTGFDFKVLAYESQMKQACINTRCSA